MSELVADFHIHSRYSRATSNQLTIQELAKWAKIKGIGVIGTGDFTHPLWLQELEEALRSTGRGLFEYQGAQFMLTAEVCTIFYKGGRAHQIHHVLLAPSFEAVKQINKELEAFGSLSLDGRPLLHVEAWRLVEIVLGIEPRCMVIPAHAWTPHFAIFGSNSGFDSVEACFEHQTKNIFALETGLSSDPAMNWRLSALDRFALISNSDSHSARKIGREANVFDCAPDYDEITTAIKTKDPAKFLYTVEFFPEEGKYHFDGHRTCKIRWAPHETKRRGFTCPTCGRRVTVGVMHRVESLADRPDGTVPARAIPFKRIVGLEEIISEAFGVGEGTQTVMREYMNLITRCGTEFQILLHAPEDTLRQVAPARVVEGIVRMRHGQVSIEPGYDGEYGTVKVFGDQEPATSEQQMTLF